MISVATALLVFRGQPPVADSWLEPAWGQSAEQVLAANPSLEEIVSSGTRYRRPLIGAAGPTDTPIGSFFASYYFYGGLARLELATTDATVCEALRSHLAALPGAAVISAPEPGWVGESSRTKYEFTSAAPDRQGLPYYSCVLKMSRL